MRLMEVGPGVFTIPIIDLPDEVYFIRDTEDDGGEQDLLHICDRSEEAFLMKQTSVEQEPAYIVTTGRVYWSFTEGTYRCYRCGMEWNTEEDLEYVWEDGIGTGYEGHA